MPSAKGRKKQKNSETARKNVIGIIPTAETPESLENGGWPMQDDPIASAKTWQKLAMV